MRTDTLMGAALRSSVLCLLMSFMSGSVAEAQPNLTFKRVTVNWPTIEMYFSVGCDGNPAYNMTKQDFRIYENGVEVKEFTLWCPDPMVRCAISVALVFDASGSMSGSGQAGAKAAGHAFVDLMDGVIDEATIVWFNSTVTVYQQMTTVKPMLHAAVDALPASGMTAAWNGAYAGLLELINNGVNQCRAVILMTDGVDNQSPDGMVQQIIGLANRNRIRIFTIGLGSGINSVDLELIAQVTGGKYFQTPNAGQLSAIYQEISTIMFQGFQECIITYERECADGSLRTVELQLRNYCGGTDTKTKTYRAPLDSSTFKTLYMELGKGEGKGGADIKIPLRLITPIDGDMFYPFQFTLEFDPSCVQFKSVSTPPGSLIEGLPISVTPVPTGALIQVTDRKLVNGSGLLMEFTFKASDPADTTCCEIRGVNPKFDQGCFIPIINPGEICVYPRKPVVTCDIDGPKELVWMRPIKDYTPNPFSVTGRFYNTGDKEAFNTRFRITYNSADVQLITPLTDIQVGAPKDLPFGGFSEVTWQLAAKRRTNAVETQICITAIFDNHEEVVCCLKVKIPPTEPILECALDAPPIVADNVNLRYVPMPFPVTVTVTNVGGMRTDSVWATIILPKDLELATPDIPDRHTKRVVPSLLFPNQSGSTSWMVRHPNTDVEKSYIVEVWVKTANADSSKCEITITIPPLESPILSPRCFVPSALVFDENLDTYVPNPFTVRLTCVNNGNTEAFDVEGTIILPPDLEFDVPQPATKMFTPSNMLKYVPPAPAPELTWTVRWTKRYRYNVTPQIRWTVTGKNFMGVRLDSTEVRCAIPIPGLMPLFACDIEMPDSLALNATETDVEPNPFTVRYTITNKSKQIGRITRLFISFPPDGLSLDPSSPNPMNQTLSLDLDKDESRTFEWIIRVQNRITRRLPLITVIALDDEGNEIRCEQYLPIANLKTALMCDVRTSEPELRYIPVLTEYEPTRFVISATLTNTGGANLNDVVAELEWTDPSGQDLVEFDPDYVDNTNPKTWGVLFPSLGQTFSWGFRLKNKNTTDVPQVLTFNIKYGSRETPFIAGGCEVPVTIEPVVAPKLICSLGGPDTVRFVVDRYDPTPFDIDVHIENIGTGDARDVKAYLLQDTRFTIISPTMRALGTLKAFSSTDLAGPNGFTVRVNPRDIDGYDTVRVTVVAEGAMTECLLPIYVERELRPRFELLCTSSAVLRFDDVLNDYTPNPFPVETRVKNVGDTRAKDCKLIFVGPPRFMPYDQVTTISLGDMEVNEERTITWQMVPWRRDVGGTETLLFQVHGSGGLGNRIVVEPCGVDIYVPPARAATYACDVTAQPISFDPTTGGYVPDPFEVTSTVRNTGLADGLGLFAEITVGSGLYVTSPTRVDLGGTLSPSGTSAPVRWTVRPIARATDGNEKVTVRYTDRFGNTTVCETMVFVPAAPEPGLLLGCASDLLKLEVDKLRGEYVQSSFSIHATVGNNSGRSVFDVEVTAISMDADLKISPLSPNPVIVAPRLDHNAPTVSVSWSVNVVPRSKSGPIRVLFLVSGKDEQGRSVPTRECSVWIDVPAVGSPNLDCRVWTSVTSQGTEDRLIAYSETLGDYEGEKSAYGDYTVFTVSAEIQNLGEAQSNRVRATLLLPEYMALEAEENALKNVTPGDIAPGGGRATVSWKVRPLAVGEDRPLTFEIVVTSENHPNEKCTHDVTLQAAQRLVQLSLPDDVVGSYGEKVTVPVLVGETLGRDIFAYKLTIRYNPSQIRFLDATNANSLTARGWNGPQARVLVEQGAAEGNLVRIEDRTTGQPLSTSRTGALVFLRFEVVHNPEQIDLIALSDLEFVSNTQTDDNRLLWSSINSVKDDEQGDVKPAFTDGAVTVSGDCVLPLTTATRLEQNRPNPFNPTTVITYRLGETGEYTLTLFDALGRKVRVLETGAKPAGTYTYVLDATGLTSGVYLYRLETPAYSDTKRMILSR